MFLLCCFYIYLSINIHLMICMMLQIKHLQNPVPICLELFAVSLLWFSQFNRYICLYTSRSWLHNQHSCSHINCFQIKYYAFSFHKPSAFNLFQSASRIFGFLPWYFFSVIFKYLLFIKSSNAA